MLLAKLAFLSSSPTMSARRIVNSSLSFITLVLKSEKCDYTLRHSLQDVHARLRIWAKDLDSDGVHLDKVLENSGLRDKFIGHLANLAGYLVVGFCHGTHPTVASAATKLTNAVSRFSDRPQSFRRSKRSITRSHR
jgi:hypothetical protein